MASIVATASPLHKYQNKTFVFGPAAFDVAADPVAACEFAAGAALEHPAKTVDKVTIARAHAITLLKLNFFIDKSLQYFFYE